MVIAKKYIVKNKFVDFIPKKTDFEIVTEDLRPLKYEEFLVEATYISVDPYMRSFANGRKVPYDQFGFQVGRVIESKNSNFKVDSNVISHSGWCDYTILNETPDSMFKMSPYLAPNIGELPLSLTVGAVGMPGLTAYLGLLEICKPKPGDVVVITSAAGAVGSLVGQIAKVMGCQVIGFTGTDEKVKILKEDLDFKNAFNYKSVDIDKCIKNVTNEGVDCFFDTVGGEVSNIIMENMKETGRVAICGSISTYVGCYKSKKKPKMPLSVQVESFSFTQWNVERYNEVFKQLVIWIQNKDIVVRETVTQGFDNLVEAFTGMLNGENIGKAVVKI